MIKTIESVKLAAAPRAEAGTSQVNRLRKQGWLPCVVYNAEGKSRLLKTQRHPFEMLMRHQGSRNLILDLEIEGAGACKVLLKEIQRDRLRDCLIHADFMEISMTQKLRVPVAVRLLGEPAGVTQQGGVLEHLIRAVEVECLPADIVKEFTLDVSALNIGDRLFVRDLKIDPKFTLLTDGALAVATVQLPHIEEEVKPEAEAGEAAAEGPEVIGKGAAAEGAEEGEAAGKEGEAKGKEAKGAEAKGKGAEAKGAEAKGKGAAAEAKGKGTAGGEAKGAEAKGKGAGPEAKGKEKGR
jgi:large subunit ribosomal protein L25